MNLQLLREEILKSIKKHKPLITKNAIKDCFTTSRDMPVFLFQSIGTKEVFKPAYDFLKQETKNIVYTGQVHVVSNNQIYRLDYASKSIYALYSLYMKEDVYIGMRIKIKNRWNLIKIWINQNKTEIKERSWSLKYLSQ